MSTMSEHRVYSKRIGLRNVQVLLLVKVGWACRNTDHLFRATSFNFYDRSTADLVITTPSIKRQHYHTCLLIFISQNQPLTSLENETYRARMLGILHHRCCSGHL